MFSHLIYLVLLLLLVNFAEEVPLPQWGENVWGALGWGLGLYSLVLAMIFLEGRWRGVNRGLLLHLVQLQLLLFMAIFLFALGGVQLVRSIPGIGQFDTVLAIVSLFLFFFGLGLFYLARDGRHSARKGMDEALQQTRLILPFVFPFLAFLLLMDLISLSPALRDWVASSDDPSYFIFNLLFLAAMLLFLAPVIIHMWQCVPMQNLELRERLENLCRKANFKHGGILDWTLLNRSHTAAILGIIPRWRYILFTKKLQEDLAPEALEAVLAHEIGHSVYRHLLIYPVILIGMVALLSLYAYFLGPYLDGWFSSRTHSAWSLIYPFALFLPYALLLWLYFRYVFGFFSRQFERQADLYPLKMGMPADQMILALDQVAKATGFTHEAPNWHHFSIRERMNFLEAAKKDPSLIGKQDRKVFWIVSAYIVFLVALFTLFFLETGQ